MAARLTAAEVWSQLESQHFGVVGFVTPRGEARSAGIVYTVRDRYGVGVPVKTMLSPVEAARRVPVS